MGKFFAAWARVLIGYNRWVGLFFLCVYLFFGANLRNTSGFPHHDTYLYHWAPRGNPSAIHEEYHNKMFLYQNQFSIDFYNEDDESIRADYLKTWQPPGNKIVE